jgi:hypothetical protein
MKKYFLVYKIYNKITNKFYIGVHETTNINDGYMGSGVYLRRAMKKYGIDNFEKQILFIFDNREDMFAKERELVSISEDTYNLMNGGNGGWSYARSKVTEETHKKISETMRSENYKNKTKTQREKSSVRIKQLQKDPFVREKQAKSLKETMNNPEWKNTIGKERSRKISESIRKNIDKFINPERNKKVSESMSGRVCVIIDGVKRRIKKDDPILQQDNIVFGWY